MSSETQAGPSTTKDPRTQCVHPRVDGEPCKNQNVTTTKKYRESDQKADKDKTEEDIYQDTLCGTHRRLRQQELSETVGVRQRFTQMTFREASVNETEEDASGDSPVVDNISQESSRPRSHNLDQRYNREPFPERSSSAAPSEDSNAQNAAGGGSRARPSQENPSDYPPLPGQAGSSDASSSPHRRRQPHTESSRTKRSSHGSGGSQIEDRMDDLEISATNGPEQLETLIRHVIDLQEQTSVIGEDVSEIQEVVAHGRNKAREQRKYQKAGFKAVRGDLEGGVSKILRQQVTLTKNVNQLEKYIHQVYEILHQQRLALLDVNLQMADEIHQMKCAFLDTKPSLAYKEDERESLKSQIQAQFGVINKTRARVSSIHHEGTWDEESSGFSEVESERGENRGGEGSSGTPRRPRFRDV